MEGLAIDFNLAVLDLAHCMDGAVLDMVGSKSSGFARYRSWRVRAVVIVTSTYHEHPRRALCVTRDVRDTQIQQSDSPGVEVLLSMR